MFSELRNPKSKKQIQTVNKSSTALTLPGISKTLKYSETERKQNKLSYIETINSISENVEYSDKNTFYLTNQQSRLKEILKKMNNDTLHMIDNIRPKKNIAKISKEQLTLLTEKQVENSKKSIAIMQLQIQQLQQKWTKIAQQMQEQEIVNKTKQIKQEIEQLRNTNLSMKLHIDKDGKEIVKQYSDGYDFKLTSLENDKVMMDQKYQKLKGENNKVIEQSNKVQSRLKEVQSKIEEYGEQYNQIKSNSNQETTSKNNEFRLRERKYHYDTIKKRIEYQNNQLQYKYYKLLKELQNKKSTCGELQSKETQTNERITKTKQDILMYQKEIEKLKRKKQQKNRSVRLFLQQERRNKQQFSQLGESAIINRQLSSTQNDKAEAIDLNRKWQSEPLDQISQKLIQSQLNFHELNKQFKEKNTSKPQQISKEPIFKLSNHENSIVDQIINK